jgi:hypothetical protein
MNPYALQGGRATLCAWKDRPISSSAGYCLNSNCAADEDELKRLSRLAR